MQEIKYGSHDEWLDIRKRYIGGSDAGAVVGMNPYQSAYSLWAEKTGRVPPFEGNLTTQVGTYLEQMVADLFEEQSGLKVRRKNRTIVNPEYPWACANVDRVIVGKNALLECKTTNNFGRMKLLRGGEFPEEWYCQCVHYLAVTGAERIYLAVLINCREFKYFTLERDEEEIQSLMDAEKEFWTYVQEDREPPVDGSNATSETLTTIYADSTDREISLFGRDGILTERQALNAQKKELDNRIKEIENQIKSEMMDATKAYSKEFKITWTPQNRKTLDQDALRAEHPEINLDKYYKTSTSRVLRITRL